MTLRDHLAAQGADATGLTDRGQGTLGTISGILAAAVASMQKGMMAGLVRREGES